jgi:hypothetical protein
MSVTRPTAGGRGTSPSGESAVTGVEAASSTESSGGAEPPMKRLGIHPVFGSSERRRDAVRR